MMENKKSAVDLTDLALGLLVLGIVVTIGSSILIGMRDARLTDLATVQTVNESTFINTTTDTLANVWVKSVDACINGSSNVTIPAANYTVSINDANGVATITNGTVSVYSDAKCTYTWYNTSKPEWALADDAANGLGEYGNWFKIIVIVGVAAVILALIFMAFGRGAGSVGSTQGY